MSFNLFGFTVLSKDEWTAIKSNIDSLMTQVQELKNNVSSLQTKLVNSNLTYPKSYGQITWKEETDLLHTICPVVWITDDFLNVTTKDEAMAFTIETAVAKGIWTTNNHDCDNFDAALYGYWNNGLISYAFGYARSDNHAFNVMIDDKKQIWIVEPQNNQFMTIDQAKQRTSPDGLHYFPISMILM